MENCRTLKGQSVGGPKSAQEFQKIFQTFCEGRGSRAGQTTVARFASLKQQLGDKLIEHGYYIRRHGEDMPEIRNWTCAGAALEIPV
jgi:hypothetical protein